MARIAFLGTGLMGAPMARNLLKAGHDVAVWNRTASKAEALASYGARVALTLAEAVCGAEFIIMIVADGKVGLEIMADSDLRKALSKDAIWIDMSSALPDEARAQSTSLAELGVHYVDAPVSGGVPGAEAGTLAIMAGGQADVVISATPVFEAMGRAIHVGPSGSGQLAKLANQAIVAITIGAVAEAMLFLRETGADPAGVREALKGGFADSTILQMHGERMTTGNFAPGGPSHLQLKDLRNVLSEAADAGLSLPMVQSTHDRYARLVSDLSGEMKDHSALFLELCDLNNLKGE